MLKKLRTSKGDYWIKQWFSAIGPLFNRKGFAPRGSKFIYLRAVPYGMENHFLPHEVTSLDCYYFCYAPAWLRNGSYANDNYTHITKDFLNSLFPAVIQMLKFIWQNIHSVFRFCCYNFIQYKLIVIAYFSHSKIMLTWPEVVKLFPCSTQLSVKFQRLIKTNIPKSEEVSYFKSLRVVFIMLINIKMPKIVSILTSMKRINFVLSCIEHENSFIT